MSSEESSYIEDIDMEEIKEQLRIIQNNQNDMMQIISDNIKNIIVGKCDTCFNIKLVYCNFYINKIIHTCVGCGGTP
jgi:hypothetical protein